MLSPEIRSRFFKFFTAHDHTKVESSSLIPAQDPTLLFTNAGMNQFKDLFLGLEKRSYSRAVSIQKCVRAGGKHNDLDNVGFTKRHLTFFEMMGNFSFNNYFKKEAIQFAWDFLTKELAIPITDLHASVFTTDDESYDIWLNTIQLPAHKIHRLGENENFWSMGDVGPCGPCTEIHIDRGPQFGCTDNIHCGPACECDRYLEIWNVVFMQFDRQSDGTLKELAQKGVDTGMGLERLCAVMQNKDSVFQTDIFTAIITHIETITHTSYSQQTDVLKAAFHVLADHIRSTTLLINDGCAPSNDGRGYVLRKIIRRAALFAEKLSTDHTLFPELSRIVIKELSPYYPDLKENETLIYEVLTSEIEKFSHNLSRGKLILEKYFKENTDTKTISGEQAFKMYDTFGFPLELIILISQEHGYKVDIKNFDTMMHQQQMQSGKKINDPLDTFEFDTPIETLFTGYTELETQSTINGLIYQDKLANSVKTGQSCWVLAKKSPFFIVGGGQVPDAGFLTIDQHTIPINKIRFINGKIAALIQAPCTITIGDTIISHVDPIWRAKAMKNHTGTHLLQAALIEVLGKTVKQAGSLVHPDYLRFDFTYHENISDENIKKIESIANQKIQENIPVSITETTMKEAIKHGALAFFGDKYNPEKVRMVDVGGFSIELCGGTHVPATGVIGLLKIIEVSALSAGHRRIVAVTGPKAIELFQEAFNISKQLCQEFKVKKETIIDSVTTLKTQLKKLQSDISTLKKELWLEKTDTWLKQTKIINNIPFLYSAINNATGEDLKEIAILLEKKQSGFYFLISSCHPTTKQAIFFAYASKNLLATIDLKSLALWLKEKHNLHGGAANNSIRGGGEIDTQTLGERIKGWLEKHAQ